MTPSSSALILSPRIVICDEPTSALDVSVQAQIINLLRDLRHELGLTLIVISDDLGGIRHLADRVAVMYLGAVIEPGDAQALFGEARHPYTQTLLAATGAAAGMQLPSVLRDRRRALPARDTPSRRASASGRLPSGGLG